ncbi:MAG: hypothetical protein JW885_11595 [Deltaproteobacteria bacterium]|nr:hypothetical protein [Candidatus Zymogenaceae bacterium]
MAKMTSADWRAVNYFTPREFHHPDKMETDIIALLDDLRDVFKFQFVIHSDWRKPPDGVPPELWPSEHNHGRAVDFHVENLDYLDAADLMKFSLRRLDVWQSVGLGLYPHWNNPGFHLDTRGYMARWGAVHRNGKQTYVTYNEAYRLI